jgi:hypothetical protein
MEPGRGYFFASTVGSGTEHLPGSMPPKVRHADNSLKWIDGTKSFFISIGEGFSKALAKGGARCRDTRGDVFRDER